MQLNIKEFLDEACIDEAFYPGKRLVKQCRQAGEYKSHCIVLDWRNPDKIKIEVKAGLSGKDLEPAQLKYYPVSFQTPTYVDIEIVNDNEREDEDKEEGKSGKSGSGSKGQKKKKSLSLASEAFGEAIEGKVPELGKIVEMVVLGTKLAVDGFAGAMSKLAQGVAHGKVMTTEMLAQAGKLVTKFTPPSFMKPKGDENAKYTYSVEKNADIGYRPNLS